MSALMWRLLNGELPTTWVPRVVVIMVGTADLEGNACRSLAGARDVTNKLHQMLYYILEKLPTTHVVFVSILPKGAFW